MYPEEDGERTLMEQERKVVGTVTVGTGLGKR